MKFSHGRRRLIKTLLGAGGYSFLPAWTPSAFGVSDYSGKFLINLELDGGMDVTSFCDPKTNVAGEPEINHWARNADIMQAGNIAYAPFGANSELFENHYKKMLVINGVDAQTNSHTVGKVNNWSGRNSDGYPSLTALMAAIYAPDLPLAYINFGGFGATSGIINSTRIGQTRQLKSLIFPNEITGTYVPTRILNSDLLRIQAMQKKVIQEKLNDANLPEGTRRQRVAYAQALEQAEGLKAFGDLIPDEEFIQPYRKVAKVGESSLHQQIQVTLLAFKAGVSVAADVIELGYDTHDTHDGKHEPLLANSADAVNYLWNYAEELGIADRVVLVIGSDFSRTPYYNAGAGKDHWPIGSYVIMEKNAGFTNRVLGGTDEGHNAFRISNRTLQRDDDDGVILRPAHVHKALRKYLGLQSSLITQRFQFGGIEDFPFFS